MAINARIFEKPEDVFEYLVKNKGVLPKTIRKINSLKNIFDPIDSLLINDPYSPQREKDDIEKKYDSSEEFVAKTKNDDEITIIIRKLKDGSFDCFISNHPDHYHRI